MPRRGAGSGVCLSQKGYLQVTRRGPDRNKYVHRLVAAAMCREWCYYPVGEDGLPEGMEVHHADFNKLHNCPSNLILVDSAFHLYMDIHHYRENGTYTRRKPPAPAAVDDEPPDWVTREEQEYDCA